MITSLILEGPSNVSGQIQRWLGEYLRLPRGAPGEVIRWSWMTSWPWGLDLPLVVTALLIVGLLAVITVLYRRDARGLSGGRPMVLITIRAAALLLLLLLLARLSISVERTGLPQVVVLIDDSASMGLRDAYLTEPDRSEVSRLLGSTASSSAPEAERFELIRRILGRDEGRWLRELARQHRVRIARFATEVVPVQRELVDDEALIHLQAELAEMRPEGDGTRPAEAVRQVLRQTRGTPPAAIVLLTDGIASTGPADRLSAAAPLARQFLVPLFVVGIGSDQPTRDVQLAELMVDDLAFVNDPLLFSAKLKAFGFAGQSATIELHARGTDSALIRKNVKLPADGQTVTVELRHTPTIPGDYDFTLRVVPPQGDLDPDNNLLSRTIRVREGKLKILLADGAPRWEFRELKNTLEREPTIELHTLLQEADLEFSLQDATAKPLQGRFPLTKELLASYDVLVLGDLNPGAFAPGVLDNVREFVRDGGGVLFVAGPQFMPLAFRGTAFESLIPVELETARVPPTEAELRQPFRPQWTPVGRLSTPLFRHLELDPDELDVPEERRRAHDPWKSLPGFFWLCETPRLKAGASVLLENPDQRGEQQPLPVITLQRFGAGKVLFHATDELWRWRFRDDARIYSQYWVQALRFLSRSSGLSPGRGLEFTTDRQTYQRGEAVKFRLQVRDDRLLPASGRATVMLERPGEARRSIELSRPANATQVFQGEQRGLREGRYHAWLAEPSVAGSPPMLDFVIEAPQRELLQRKLERSDLEAAARISLGRYYSLAEVDRLPKEIPPGQPVPLSAPKVVPLWNRWEMLLLFAGLLTTEWVCRRRWRLL